MSISFTELAGLPSPFYRVAVKAVILDEQKRLLVGLNEDGDYEMPGGGWEHGESLEECAQREIQEEFGVRAIDISPIRFTFQAKSEHGWSVLRLVVDAALASRDFVPGDSITTARFVSKDELLGLNFAITDEGIKDFVDVIWPKGV